MTSRDNLIEGSCEFIRGSSLCYVTTLNLPLDHKHCDSGDVFNLSRDVSETHLKGYLNFWVEVSHCELPPCNV